ncbi:MAG: flavin reductase family protein [Oscillospiraceae bacterium]|nr:flavin reductase family protein [Oscillospiraceae bacterium]
MSFIKKTTAELSANPFETIGKDWFLLTAGTPEQFNTMTCSWGAMGVIWNDPAVTAYVRTNRHTFGYLEESPLFTISVLPEEYRKVLSYCGSHSGRDVDKVKETGLTPVTLGGAPAFAEARLVFVCEKVYAQMLDENCFVLPETKTAYYSKDPMHKMYIGRIKAVYVNE